MAMKEKNADDRIVIRRYKPSDVDAIKKLFVEGMKSNLIAGFQAILSNPFILTSMASLSFVSSVLLQYFLGSQNNKAGLALPSIMAVGVGTPLISCSSFLYYALYKELNGYIQYSLRTDLSNIESVYGGKGCFLVAVDASDPKNDVVVGMVAGEHKPSGNTGEERRFELRRMSVSSSVRKKGVGKRLVRRLEHELKPQSMFLTCTSMQYPALALYQSLGFSLQPIKANGRSSGIFGNSIKFIRFEKVYKQ